MAAIQKDFSNIPTPSNWHWAITYEQIEKIKAGNIDELNKVYFDNLSVFRGMAYNWCAKRRVYDFFDDCINQIYVELPSYDFENAYTFCWSIRKSFHRATFFTKKCVSLDEPVNEEDSETIGNFIPDRTPSAQELIEARESLEENASKLYHRLFSFFDRSSEDVREVLGYMYPHIEYDEILQLAGVA